MPATPLYDHDVLFPKLSEQQMAVLRKHGVTRRYAAGAVIIAVGQQHMDLNVVVSGALEIVRRDGDAATVAATLNPREFGGEFSMLGGRRSLFETRAKEDSEVLAISESELRNIIATNAELSELIMRSFIERRLTMIKTGLGGVRIIGSRHSVDTLRIREFLSRNFHPFTYLDVEQDSETAALLEGLRVRPEEIPIVLSRDTQFMRNPSNRELADALGVSDQASREKLYDFAIVGAGPAGLAAAVYAASEGLSVIVLDSQAPGGQAGTSSSIENYLGFPTGITGQALAARAHVQAQKFGAEFLAAREVVRLRCGEGHPVIEIDGGDTVRSRAVLIASGARYRKPEVADIERFEGRGIYYRASHMEAQFCRDGEVVVIGGGNSAGQATVFLAGHARHVHVLVRGNGLAETMSRYLIQRIESLPNMTLHTRTEIVGLAGDGDLERVTWRHRDTGATEEREIGQVFVFIGADPNTGWLRDCVALDDKGFVRTGNDLRPADFVGTNWPIHRLPHPFETNRPGVFAAGDVRSGSVKRVASSVGEGAVVVQYLHAFLQE